MIGIVATRMIPVVDIIGGLLLCAMFDASTAPDVLVSVLCNPEESASKLVVGLVLAN
jgi:hypothetical protein